MDHGNSKKKIDWLSLTNSIECQSNVEHNDGMGDSTDEKRGDDAHQPYFSEPFLSGISRFALQR